MIELRHGISIPVYPSCFFVLTPSCRTLSQLPGDEKEMKAHLLEIDGKRIDHVFESIESMESFIVDYLIRNDKLEYHAEEEY